MSLSRKLRLFAPLAVLTVAFPAQAQTVPHANQYGLGLIGAPAAWALGYTGNGVTVAVADTGIELTHPAFAGAGKIDPRGRNYVLPAQGAAYDINQFGEADRGGHGTHVAGIIGAGAASGVPGIAYNASLLSLRMTPGCAKGQNCGAPGVPNASASAINYFATLDNVMIYNGSYGPDSGKGQTVWPSSTIDADEETAVRAALARGKIIVSANGNDREENPVAGLHPNGIALYPFIQPANAKAGVYNDDNNNYDFSALLRQPGLVIAVNSVGEAKTIAPYSQACGATASWCVSAPGGNQAVDAGIYSSLPNATYGYQQGTSMAAPAVSGALAVLQQAYPNYAARDLAHVLFATAENVGGHAGLNATYGYGLIRLDRAVAGPTTLAAGTAVNVANQQVTYWSQPLTTAGAFSKTGAGSLIVAGRTTTAGNVTINEGALGVGGTLTLGSGMTVAQGATLAGFGRIVGNTTVSGTLSPGQLPNYADLIANNNGAMPADVPLTGTSIGTLTIQGRMVLDASATLQAGIDGTQRNPGGPGTYDKLVVTGAGSTFTAGGTLAPVLRGIVGGTNSFTPALGTAFPIILAEEGGALTGQFASLSQPTAGLAANTRFDVAYTATSVTLNITPSSFTALAATDTKLNDNQKAVAGALDAVRPEPGVRARSRQPSWNDLYDNDLDDLEDDLAQLSGQGLAANAGVVMNGFNSFSRLIAGRQSLLAGFAAGPIRLAQAGSGVASDAAMASPDRWTGWAQGFGHWSQVGDTLGLPGADSSGAGFSIGADRAFARDLIAGGALGYASDDIESFAAASRSVSYAAAMYATWTPGNFVLDGQLAAGAADIDTFRIVGFLGSTPVSGAADGWSLLGAVRAGYRFDAGAVTFKPYAGLRAQNFHLNSYWETTDIGLFFPAQDFTSIASSLGLESTAEFAVGSITLRPTASAAWLHDLRDGALVTRAALFDAPFEIDAAAPGRDGAEVNFELSVSWTDSFSLFAGYGGEFRRNATSHEARGGLRVAF